MFVDVGERLYNIENSIHIDTGNIDYDHHDSNNMISAASLVYSLNNLNDPALKKIVDYTVLVDHGKMIIENTHFMNLTSALTGLLSSESEQTVNAALVILDGIYNNLQFEFKAEEEYKNGVTFNSDFGTGIAFQTENSSLRRKVYQNGYDIFLFKDNKTGFAGYKADGNSTIDFSNLYKRIKKIEPNADWFLHSSNQLLLCGSSKAPCKRLTNLSLNELISIISEYA
jgi:hypothetical protein